MQNTIKSRAEWLIAAGLFVSSFALYLRTLAPSVAFMFDDSLEMQSIVPRLGIPHPTGYPLYALLGKLFTLIVPLNDAAFRLNLFSALCAALTIPVLYFTLRQLSAHQIPSLVGALLFAVSRTFWEQAVVAEVYALQMLLAGLILLAALRWGAQPNARRFYWLALAMGLGLAHHRLVVLLYPAIAVYVLLVNKSILREYKVLARAALLFLAPLMLYAYLPLRGAVGSADGAYENTLAGFLSWASGAQYTVFLTQDPLKVQHDVAFYASLFQSQLGILGLLACLVGIIWLAHEPREWALLLIALASEALFAFNYRTADVEVHFLTTFFVLSIFAGAGMDGIFHVLTPRQSSFAFQASRVLLALLLFLIPVQLLFANFSANDLSAKWDIHDYGLDLLAQPTEPNATLVGILGEMTLVRYFQANQGLRTDLQTVPADKEADRLAAIETALNQSRVVYLTRPLQGAAEKYALDSIGPLIRVRLKAAPDDPKIANSLDEDFGAVRLIGYAVDESRLGSTQDWHAQNGRILRVTVYWKVDAVPSADALVSLKIMGKDRHVVGQIDQHPVRDTYPTNQWRAGETIADTYDVPVFLGAAPGYYTVNVTLFDAKSGAVFGSKELKTIALAPDMVTPRRETWNVLHTSDADFGTFALAGYTLDPEAAVRPGDPLPLTLLWRANQPNVDSSIKLRVWLEDSSGKSAASRDAAIGSGYPASAWQPGQFVRDTPLVRVPANVADGKYRVKLAAVRGEQLLGSMPLRPSTADLGLVEIKNRTRVMTAPVSISRPQEAAFDKKIRFLGSDFTADAATRQARLVLYWKSLALIDSSYSVFVHLLDNGGKVIAAGDAAPGGGEFATTGWVVDEFVTDVHSFVIPDGVAPGSYRVEIGWYDPVSGTRLPTADGQDRVLLAPVNVP